MAALEIIIKAPELAEAINNLAAALGKGGFTGSVTPASDPASISDPDMVKLPGGEDPKKYTMFNDMAAAAQKLRDANAKVYERVLRKYVAADKKYSAIEAKDWGKATKEFKKALADLSKTGEEEEEDSNVATEIMYYFHPESESVGIVKKGEEIPEEPDLEWLTKSEYVKKKKELEELAAEEENTGEEEVEDDYSEDETEAPRLTDKELRALAAKASNAGVKVGPIMKKIAGVTKVSAIPTEKYNAFEDALKAAMEE